MHTITGLDELRQAEGQELGTSDWHEVTQSDVNTFADVTGDHQWIHVDPDRARSTPFGGTIAHGYYTLSLAPGLGEQIFAFQGFAFAVNYGLNRVRFPAPLPVGEYTDNLRAAGFVDVSITFTNEVGDGIHSAIVRGMKPAG